MYPRTLIGRICCFVLLISQTTSSSNSGVQLPSYDVTNTDFLNTQTVKLCLLARMNISIQFTYKSETELITHTIFIPPDAKNGDSKCDFDFVSILRLSFDGVLFALHFRRTEVSMSKTRIGYCEGCENGNWWLDKIFVESSNTSLILTHAPPTQLVSTINGSSVSSEAGGFITGVSLKRGYRCREHVLYANLSVTEAINLMTKKHVSNQWLVEVYFYSIDIQPFLVTNDIVKDPLLCKDFTLFLILIILLPLLYFAIFIAYYRLKERFGFPNLRKKWPKLSLKKKDGSKQLLAASANFTSSPTCALSKTSTVTITCTTSEGKEMDILKSSASC